MLQFEELRLELEGLEPEIRDLSEALGLKAMANEVAELDMKASEPGFWDDMEKSQKILQRSSMLKNKIESYEKLKAAYGDTMALIELADEEEIFPCCLRPKRSLPKLRKVWKLSVYLPFYRVNTIARTPSLHFTLGRAARKPRIGRRCSTVCITDGPSAILIR